MTAISQLNGAVALTAPASADVLPITDVSDTTENANGTTKKITWANLFQSPTLVTPDLGTPSAGTLTNCTGYTAANLSGLGSNVATFLATPSSANLRAALTDEVGTGAAYFVGGALGTPASGTLTNATGLPVSTGLAGLGTGVATLLATPSSANLAAAVTDETGSGALVFANSPSLTTPSIGAATATTINGTAVPSSATLAVVSTPVSVSSTTSLDRATHGNRYLVCTNTITLTVLDDAAGGWGAGDVVYGRNAGSGIVTLAADASGTPSNVTASAGQTLIVYPGQQFAVSREGTSAWFGGADAPDSMTIAIGDETTEITTGTAKVTFRFPYAGRLVGVRGNLTTASSSGTPTFDLNEAGTTMLSTKLTIDANELTSVTAASAAVISDAAFADDAQGTIDVDTAGTGAAGAKITIYTVRTS